MASSSLAKLIASARWKDQTFTGFRQYIDEGEVNPRDDREIPQTFEAYALRGVLGKANGPSGLSTQKPGRRQPA
jgi:hypothetical protein